MCTKKPVTAAKRAERGVTFSRIPYRLIDEAMLEEIRDASQVRRLCWGDISHDFIGEVLITGDTFDEDMMSRVCLGVSPDEGKHTCGAIIGYTGISTRLISLVLAERTRFVIVKASPYIGDFSDDEGFVYMLPPWLYAHHVEATSTDRSHISVIKSATKFIEDLSLDADLRQHTIESYRESAAVEIEKGTRRGMFVRDA